MKRADLLTGQTVTPMLLCAVSRRKTTI